ncbi:MAG: peptidoglycan DD-metalloendopeptidase family protein [Sphingobacteriaceae bacterium]|nr:peptidoglycan DD-metalloendopeptidase family protein [Sphingobacteriaceae bacterium]
MTQFNFKKTINSSWLLFAFFVIAFSVNAQHHSNGKSELESKKKKITEEIHEINNILRETKANKKVTLGALLNLNMKLEKRQELINTILAQINILNKDIEITESKVDALKKSLNKLKNEYARMIITAQRNQDSYSKLMFIFASNDFNQAYARLKYFQQYSEYRKKQAVEIVETQTQLIASLNELKQQRSEKNILLGNEETEKNILNTEKAEQETVISALQSKENELKRELEKKKRETYELQLAIKKIIAEEIKRKAEEVAKKRAEELARKKAEAAKNKTNKATNKSNETKVANTTSETKSLPELDAEDIALSADFADNRGKLPWPVGKGVICEPYGEHEHPAIKGFMIVNNGLEICSGNGAEARAVFAGEVRSIAVSPTGGKLVIVKHGEYMSVYCNLSDVHVKMGQKVESKQAIGKVMYNDDEGKTSMNFQIWKGQKTMDPGGWLYKGR